MTMPRKMHCSNPDCPHERSLYFSDWLKDAMPDSDTGFYIHDVDKVLCNTVSKKIMFLESKTNGCTPDPWQQILMDNIRFMMTRGAEFMPRPWAFVGYPNIRFERYTFKDGKCYFEGKELTDLGLKETIINLLK